MNINFNDFINKLPKYKHINEDYYKIIEMKEALEKITNEKLYVDDDYLILPFYICKDGTYEIYHYEYSINIEEMSCFEEYIKIKANETVINLKIKEKMKTHYSDMIKSKNPFVSSILTTYFDEIINSIDLKNEILFVFARAGKDHEYDINNLYFVVY